ncbi:hypothetical protein DM02DRAFT_527760 [Periconia macrospinosa]|uniref:Uncharacterized protein n=1 Tax=Periconia macrospinosa TaxID=97972 RepID=A0A2V1DQ78_9PLEO|nr:hypothetical protein DM02DRAFT_527760 [Periconia macrospinosa]
MAAISQLDLPLYHVNLSLIAYLDSAIGIDPEHMINVIAFSTADSIYVRSSVVQDPHKSLREGLSQIRRIFGNVGKPGITLMVPPSEVMVREFDPASWRIASYSPFDWIPLDSFKNTSAHLSFTEYQMKVYDGARGMHDSQLSFIEPVLSVRDKGSWVADINPLVFGPYCTHLFFECDHPKNQPPKDHNKELTVVDSWEELLDLPGGDFVIRTGGNWVARFALTLVTHQKLLETGLGFRVLVCPEEVCWTCALSEPRRFSQMRNVFIF